MSDQISERATQFHPLPGGEGERNQSYLPTFFSRTFVSALLLIGLPAHGATPAESPRKKISLDDNWRFTKGDPTNNPVSLLYDERKSQNVRRFAQEADGNSALNQSVANETTNASAFIKRWILPTGNDFIADAASKFTRPEGNLGDGIDYVRPDFDDSSWQKINLPHDWAIEGPFTHSGGGGMGRLPTAGVGWYRKALDIPASDANKSIFLQVDGAMSYAMVWLNGKIAGGWPFGYASWRVDLTPYVKPGGANELAIRLDNPPNSSRWYPGAGIYRNVWLVRTEHVHVGLWGTQAATPEVSKERATVNLKVTVENESKTAANVSVATEIFAVDANGGKTGEALATIVPVELHIPVGGKSTADGAATIANPKLWGPSPTQKPNRYVALTTVSQDGNVVDLYATPFGIRTLKFDPNTGVWINGEHIDLKGVCDHHDLGALGAAVNVRALQRQLEMLQEMGCNAIRTSHNPPAPELLELADQMGFVVMDEAFDCWARQKTPFDFHLIFPDWHEPDLRAQIRRDRNHPSVIMWSIGNEVGEQFTGPSGGVIAKELCDIVHAEDPTRPTTTAMNVAHPGDPLPDAVDLVGLNYQGAGIRGMPGQYDAFHQKYPDKLIYSSESADAWSSRGEYMFPVPVTNSLAASGNVGQNRTNHQVSAYELFSAPFGSSADRVFESQERHPFAGGEFVWTGWDYLGEPSPFDTSRSSYSGIIDLAGFKKDRFYLYQAHWRPDFRMAHILPHWTWSERVGQVTPVHVFTSGDEGELFLNGKSLGRKKKGRFEYRLRWDEVVYQPGSLKVVVYKNGKQWASDEMKTAGSAAKLKLEPDRDTIRADGKDLSFVTLTVTDKAGLMSPRADNSIHFEIEGPGEIVATDNGDATDFVPFPSHDRKAFNGLCLVIVRGKAGQAGKIKITATAGGLKAVSASIKTAAGEIARK